MATPFELWALLSHNDESEATMTMVPSFDYELAPTLEVALTALADGATPMHGGTELLPAMGLGLLRPERVVSLRKLDELRVCRREDDDLVLGAGLTHDYVSNSAIVAEAAPLLAEVSLGVGNIRVRCTGTLGGNLAFAEPRSDLTTVLLALDARVRLASKTSRREIPIGDFLLGAYDTDIRNGELITAIALPFGLARQGSYRKVVFSERPVVGVALTFVAERGWRLVIGAVAMEPVVLDYDDLEQIDPTAIAAGIEAMGDLAGTEEYKVHLTAVTIKRCREAVAAQQGLDS